MSTGHFFYRFIRRTFNVQQEQLGLTKLLLFGFVLLAISLTILSIFIGIGVKLFLICLGLSSIYLFLYRRDFKSKIFSYISAVKSYPTLFKVILMVLLPYAVIMSLGENFIISDSYLYHIQTLQWIQFGGAIPGLANLQTSFPYNSHSLVISSLFTYFADQTHIVFTLNGFFYLLLSLVLIHKMVLFRDNKFYFLFFATILLAFVTFISIILNNSSPDILTTIVIAFIFIFIVEAQFERLHSLQYLLIPLIVLVFALRTSGFFVLILLLLFLFKSKNIFWYALITGILIVIPLMARNLIASGYPLYPTKLFDVFQFDWKCPPHILDSLYADIKLSSRAHTPIDTLFFPSSFEAFVFWYKKINIMVSTMFFVNIYLFYEFIKNVLSKNWNRTIILLCLLVNLLFCFFYLPQLRYFYGFIFVSFSFTLAFITMKFKILNLKIIKTVFIVFIFSSIILRVATALKIEFNESLLWYPAPHDFVVKEAKEVKVKTNFEYIYVINNLSYGCGTRPIPCGGGPNIYLRGERLEDGFYTKETDKQK